MTVYHLHIPRTSGVYVRTLLLKGRTTEESVAGHYRTVSESDFAKAKTISGHYGLSPCPYADKTFAIVRRPEHLTFSYIKYLSLFNGSNAFTEDHLKRYLNEDKLRDSVTNVISKFLSLKLDLNLYNKNIKDLLQMANNSWYLEKLKYSDQTAIDSIKRNNIKIFHYESESLYKDLAQFLSISEDSFAVDKINASPADRSDLYNKYYNDIINLNSTDNQLYERLLGV